MKPLTAIACALVLTGCTNLDLSLLEEVGVNPDIVYEVEDATLGNAAKGLRIYCQAPQAARLVLRSRMDMRPEANGAKIRVDCPGDS